MLRNLLVRTLWGLSLFLIVPASADAQSCGVGGCSTGGCGSTGTIGANTVVGLGPLARWFGHGLADKYCCAPTHGCPGYVHCQPKPPDMYFPRVCGKPVCEPCTLEHFGYYNTCWAPWGFPPDFSHCPTPQLAAIVPTSFPKTQYFSPDPRAQQPDLVEDPPMKEMTPSMKEKEMMDKEREREKMEKESRRYTPGQLTPVNLAPPVSRPVLAAPVSTAPPVSAVPVRATVAPPSQVGYETLPQPRNNYGSPSPYIPR